jgi:hypothetical protein
LFEYAAVPSAYRARLILSMEATLTSNPIMPILEIGAMLREQAELRG